MWPVERGARHPVVGLLGVCVVEVFVGGLGLELVELLLPLSSSCEPWMGRLQAEQEMFRMEGVGGTSVLPMLLESTAHS